MDEDHSDTDSESEESNTYGFKSPRRPPPLKETAAFEKDLWDIVYNTKFTKYRQPFQNILKDELKKMKTSEEIYLPADKTGNFYETKPELYSELLLNNICDRYRKELSIIEQN